MSNNSDWTGRYDTPEYAAWKKSVLGNTLTELATRIEQAEGPSRELFEEAFAACYPEPAAGCEPRWRPENPRQPLFHAWKTRQIAFQHFVNAGAWLDAAMTLVPEGYALGFKRAPCQRSHAMLATIGYEANASGATPALALCAAALRARGAA